MSQATLAKRCDDEDATDATEVKINLRARRGDRDLIDRAAAITRKTRTEFMLDSSRQAATDTLLDQTFFALSGDDWNKFLAALTSPPRRAAKLKALMQRKSPWEN